MKIAGVSNRESVPESLRIACDISRACRPTWVSPISPSISARGTSAATESITTTSTAPDLGPRGEPPPRVDPHHVERARTHEHVGDLERLLAGVRLRHQELVDVH